MQPGDLTQCPKRSVSSLWWSRSGEEASASRASMLPCVNSTEAWVSLWGTCSQEQEKEWREQVVHDWARILYPDAFPNGDGWLYRESLSEQVASSHLPTLPPDRLPHNPPNFRFHIFLNPVREPNPCRPGQHVPVRVRPRNRDERLGCGGISNRRPHPPSRNLDLSPGR